MQQKQTTEVWKGSDKESFKDPQFQNRGVESLEYAGMENVPMEEQRVPRNGTVLPAPCPAGSQADHFECFLSISVQENFRNFSPDELRLKWLVSHGADPGCHWRLVLC